MKLTLEAIYVLGLPVALVVFFVTVLRFVTSGRSTWEGVSLADVVATVTLTLLLTWFWPVALPVLVLSKALQVTINRVRA